METKLPEVSTATPMPPVKPPKTSESRLIELLNAWKAQEKEFSETLQIGRCGDDDGSYRHGRYSMLEDCIIDLEEALGI